MSIAAAAAAFAAEMDADDPLKDLLSRLLDRHDEWNRDANAQLEELQVMASSSVPPTPPARPRLRFCIVTGRA